MIAIVIDGQSSASNVAIPSDFRHSLQCILSIPFLYRVLPPLLLSSIYVQIYWQRVTYFVNEVTIFLGPLLFSVWCLGGEQRCDSVLEMTPCLHVLEFTLITIGPSMFLHDLDLLFARFVHTLINIYLAIFHLLILRYVLRSLSDIITDGFLEERPPFHVLDVFLCAICPSIFLHYRYYIFWWLPHTFFFVNATVSLLLILGVFASTHCGGVRIANQLQSDWIGMWREALYKGTYSSCVFLKMFSVIFLKMCCLTN